MLVGYVRRARVIGRTSYWVFPIALRCAPIREFIAEYVSGAGGGGGGGLGDAAQIKHGQAYGASSGAGVPSGVTQVDMLVPDGVATVTFVYPAGEVGGFGRDRAPAFTTTTRAVDNLTVADIPRANRRLAAPMTMTWRAADGHVVMTFTRL